MLCDRCKKNEAVVFIFADINGKKVKYRLCQNCAQSANIVNLPFSLISMGADFAQEGIDKKKKRSATHLSSGKEPEGIPISGENGSEALRCSVCGTTIGEVARKMRFGCANCYKIFGRDIIGSNKKTGIPSPDAEGNSLPEDISVALLKKAQIEKLKLRLARAIKKEDYERAAVIRDEIKKLTDGADIA